MNTLIAQTALTPNPSFPNPSPLVEGGLIAAIVMFLLKEGVSFFKKKDEDEAKLTSELIQDLRRERSEQLQQMIRIVQRLNQSHQQLSNAIQQNTLVLSGVNQALQHQDLANLEIQQSLRELQQQSVLLSAKIDRIGYTKNATNDSEPGKSLSRDYV